MPPELRRNCPWRFSLTDEESREAVARVVRRRQRAGVRVREEEGTYSPEQDGRVRAEAVSTNVRGSVRRSAT